MPMDRTYQRAQLTFEPIAEAVVEALERITEQQLGGASLVFCECSSCQALHVCVPGEADPILLTVPPHLWARASLQ